MPSGSLPLPPTLPKWMTRKVKPERGRRRPFALAGAVLALVLDLVARSSR
jgi:hypothetical protein